MNLPFIIALKRLFILDQLADSLFYLDFKAAQDGTKVRIVSGNNSEDIDVDQNSYSYDNNGEYEITSDGNP